MRTRRRAGIQVVEALEIRTVPATFTGSLSAVFDAPAPSAATVTGVGTSDFSWGRGTNGSAANRFQFAANRFDVDPDRVFSLGQLTYFNGITASGTEASSVDLNLQLTFSKPAGSGGGSVRYTLGMISTPNTSDPVASADYVTLGAGQSINVRIGRRDYGLEILGFGNQNGGSFTPVERFTVQEQQSASGELLARFVPLPDLVGSRFTYRVPTDTTGRANGPIPVGTEFRVEATIENQGGGPASAFTVKVYASQDAVIDPRTDFFVGDLGTISVLAARSRQMLAGDLLLPLTLPLTFFGEIHMGIVVDLADAVTESGEDNNWGQRLGRDMAKVQLYDPVSPRGPWLDPTTGTPRTFATFAAAEAFLIGQGFSWPTIPRSDLGMSRPTAGTITSRYNGTAMPAGSFRIQAGIVETARGSGIWRIFIQGAEAGFNPAALTPVLGEPSPRSASVFSPGWTRYVYNYHDRF